MLVLIFDTETTGVPIKGCTDIDKQPRIVQIAGVIYEYNNSRQWVEKTELNEIIDPGIPIPYETSKVHHLYDIDVKDKPKIDSILPLFIEIVNSVDFIVAHNLKFDEQILLYEIIRLRKKGIFLDYKPKGTICTMTSSVGICRIPKKSGNGYKVPKLQEVFKHFFGTGFAGSHDAFTDVRACGSVFKKMVDLKLIKLEKKEQKQQELF